MIVESCRIYCDPLNLSILHLGNRNCSRQFNFVYRYQPQFYFISIQDGTGLGDIYHCKVLSTSSTIIKYLGDFNLSNPSSVSYLIKAYSKSYKNIDFYIC